MKKRVYVVLFLFLFVLCASCGKDTKANKISRLIREWNVEDARRIAMKNASESDEMAALAEFTEICFNLDSYPLHYECKIDNHSTDEGIPYSYIKDIESFESKVNLLPSELWDVYIMFRDTLRVPDEVSEIDKLCHEYIENEELFLSYFAQDDAQYMEYALNAEKSLGSICELYEQSTGKSMSQEHPRIGYKYDTYQKIKGIVSGKNGTDISLKESFDLLSCRVHLNEVRSEVIFSVVKEMYGYTNRLNTIYNYMINL